MWLMGSRRVEGSTQEAFVRVAALLDQSFLEFGSGDTQSVGYPAWIARPRITEVGGSSSALGLASILRDKGMLTPVSEHRARLSLDWLAMMQSSEGAWHVDGVASCEAAAMVLIDLEDTDTFVLPIESVNRAFGYLEQCDSHQGFFLSSPTHGEEVHLFTTYAAVRTLHKYQRIGTAKSEAIKSWVLARRNERNRWAMVLGGEDSVAATCQAILTLNYLGFSWPELARQYRSTAAWIAAEAICRIREDEQFWVHHGRAGDELGVTYAVHHSCHYLPPLAGTVLVNMGRVADNMRIGTWLLRTRDGMGWGARLGETSMWATLQAVRYLQLFEARTLPNARPLDWLASKMNRETIVVARWLSAAVAVVLMLVVALRTCLESLADRESSWAHAGSATAGAGSRRTRLTSGTQSRRRSSCHAPTVTVPARRAIPRRWTSSAGRAVRAGSRFAQQWQTPLSWRRRACTGFAF